MEPDGSFVWVNRHGSLWQLDGMVYDREDAIEYVELKGTTTAVGFSAIANAMQPESIPSPLELSVHCVDTNARLTLEAFLANIDTTTQHHSIDAFHP